MDPRELFLSLQVNADAIARRYDVTPEQAREAADVFEQYLTDADAWDLVACIVSDVVERAT